MPIEDLFERLLLARTFDESFAALRLGIAGLVPFDRVALGLLDTTGRMLRLTALHSDGAPALKLGYSDPIASSTLGPLLQSNRPRFINDLAAYLAAKPTSRSTRLMVREGMRSNLSVPLRSGRRPFGFVFFSSRQVGIYTSTHAELLGRVSGAVAAALEKGSLLDALTKTTDRTVQANAPSRHAETPAWDALQALPGLRSVCQAIERVAATDATVLITGETGTGKEPVARALHERGRRADGPFVATNVAALPRELAAAELFGHEAGAFTGASRQRSGRFELADGGTLFLDEIGDLAPESQILLLRVLQTGIVERLGGGQPIAVDTRVVAATHRDLRAAVEAGTFRADLLYRLNVIPVHIPPLRERPEDIPVLVERFVRQSSARHRRPVPRVREGILDRLRSWIWPGNIRELENVVERAVIASSGIDLEMDLTWLGDQTASGPCGPWADREREAIRDALRRAGGRIYGPAGAAVLLGLKPTTLYGKMRKLGLRRGDRN